MCTQAQLAVHQGCIRGRLARLHSNLCTALTLLISTRCPGRLYRICSSGGVGRDQASESKHAGAWLCRADAQAADCTCTQPGAFAEMTLTKNLPPSVTTSSALMMCLQAGRGNRRSTRT